jgi:hypothetical protein
MQPYIFPYLGYVQLANYVDKFVLYDDANYIKGGYINRNNLLYNGKSKRFTLPVISASPNKKISELSFANNLQKPLEFIRHAYSRAPYFQDIFRLVENVLTAPEKSITGVCENGLNSIFAYLDLEVTILRSSSLNYDRTLSAADKLLSISNALGASNYVNSSGGVDLYDKEYFSDNRCELSFLKMKDFKYRQGQSEFVANLSIIDTLMWCEKRDVVEALTHYKIC